MDRTIESNIHDLKDATMFIALLVKKYGDNGVIELTDDEINSGFQNALLEVDVNEATDQLRISCTEKQ